MQNSETFNNLCVWRVARHAFFFAAILSKSFYSSRIDAFPFTIFAEVKNNDDICSRSLAVDRSYDGSGCMARDDGHKKGVYWRFVLDSSESSKFTLVVKDEATVDVLCGICRFASNGNRHIRRGLLRCSFNY